MAAKEETNRLRELKIARMICGVTYQPVYTFQDRAPVWADMLRNDLFRGVFGSPYTPHGFRLELLHSDGEIRVTHKEIAGWQLKVTRAEANFSCDSPAGANVYQLLSLQADILRIILSRLDIEYITTIGSKFVMQTELLTELGGNWTSAVLMPRPAPSLVVDDTEVDDVAFRIAYGASLGAVSLQVGFDRTTGGAIIDFDYFNQDAALWRADPGQFLSESFSHLSTRVLSFLGQFEAGSTVEIL